MRAFFVFLLLVSSSWGDLRIVALARVGSVVITNRDVLVYRALIEPQSLVRKKNLGPAREKLILDDLTVMAAAEEENDLFKSVEIGQEELAGLFRSWQVKEGLQSWKILKDEFEISEKEIKKLLLAKEILNRSQIGAESLGEWKKQLRERYPVQYFLKESSVQKTL